MADHDTDIYAPYQPDIYLSSADLSHLNSVRDEPSMLSHLGVSKNRVLDTIQDNFNLMPYPDTSTPSPSSLGTPASTDGPGPSSSPPFLLPDMLDVVHPASNQTRKQRKDKLRIDLASDQPPTTQGLPRARVFVACLEWYAPSPHRCLIAVLICFASRIRKIRCDGAKPMCFHCDQREENECTYDTLPKRRGPDKIRGARTRGAKPEDNGESPPRRRRRRPTTVEQAASGSRGITWPSVTAEPSRLDTVEDPILLVDPQPYGVFNEVVPGSESLKGSALFGTTTSHNEMLTIESGITGHTVSRLLVVF